MGMKTVSCLRANAIKSAVSACFFCLLLMGSMNRAGADPDHCYTMREAEAEQGIRIHSELMVIGLNCQHISMRETGRNIYLKYRQFTNDNKNLFAWYEDILLDFYDRTGHVSPETELNDMRTKFANKISLDAAKMRPDMFCKVYAPRIRRVENFTRADLRQWAQTFYNSHPVSQPLCERN